jgi:hypothetical protein
VGNFVAAAGENSMAIDTPCQFRAQALAKSLQAIRSKRGMPWV